MNNLSLGSELTTDLQKLYITRFTGQEAYRDRVWKILTSHFFSHWIKSSDSVLDLGCGYGEFINNVEAGKKYGIDLNPSSSNQLNSDIEFFQQDCSLQWPLPANSLDVVFTSNFFEHLPSKQGLEATLAEVLRCLKPGGFLIAVGPNIKYVGGRYWDFFDHYLPLTERSLSELFSLSGFRLERSVGQFLPYTMSMGHQPALWKLRLYLKLPVLWRFFGRQFLVVSRKPR
ncbi:MAG: class I SAM-dependent methyltransferase [Acidobacteriaceae bacterium]